MARPAKQWIYSKASPKTVPDGLRQELSAKAAALIETHLRPKYIQPPTNPQFNYVIDIFTKWRGRNFYFMSKYACPGPNRISPHFEIGFARLTFVGGDRFDLAYFRHTGKWWTVFPALTADEALELVRTEGLFHP